MRNSSIVYLVKMEYVSKTNIFGLKMMVKSGLEKKCFEIPPYIRLFSPISQKGRISPKITNSLMKMTFFAHGGISKINKLWSM